MLYSYTVTNSGERRLKVPGVPYCSVTSLSENRVVILIGWLSKHSYNYTSCYEKFYHDCYLIFIGSHACVESVWISNFCQSYRKQQNELFRFWSSFRKYADLLIKLNHEWRNNSESLLEPLCWLSFWDRLL